MNYNGIIVSRTDVFDFEKAVVFFEGVLQNLTEGSGFTQQEFFNRFGLSVAMEALTALGVIKHLHCEDDKFTWDEFFNLVGVSSPQNHLLAMLEPIPLTQKTEVALRISEVERQNPITVLDLLIKVDQSLTEDTPLNIATLSF